MTPRCLNCGAEMPEAFMNREHRCDCGYVWLAVIYDNKLRWTLIGQVKVKH